jgi:tetratricopeptide (TPR) repeat protein
MEKLVKSNRALSCFETETLRARAWQYIWHNPTEAVRFFEKSYESAIEQDDQLLSCDVLTQMALNVKDFDTARALKLVNRAEAVARNLGYNTGIRSAMNNKAMIHSACGEFNASIECYLEVIAIGEKHRTPTMHTIPGQIAWVYNEMGNGEEALEWAMMSLDTAKGRPRFQPYAYFDIARALAIQGRTEEARQYLEEGYEKSRRIALEIYLQGGYLISGEIDMAEERHLDAMHIFEKSYEIAERIGRQDRLNSSLLRATECELALFESNEDTQSAESSGLWMERLEREVAEKNIPGIRGRLLLLKSELRLKQGRRDDAETLLNEVRIMAANPRMSYLDEMVSALRTQYSIL